MAVAVTVGVAGFVAVPVAAAVGVRVAVAPGVAVAVGVAVGVAPSSRKTIEGFPHQCSFARATSDGVVLAVAAEELELPPNNPVQAASKTLDNSKPIAAYRAG